MRFTKFTLASSFIVLIGSIVVPASSSVNSRLAAPGATKTQLADGMPLPPPPREASESLLADGMPLPPPPRVDAVTLMADGMPLPPPPRADEATSALA